jgi:hypothetical protein
MIVGYVLQFIAWTILLITSGCTVFWTDDVYFCDVGNNREMEEFAMIAEPNHIEASAKRSLKDPDDVTLVTTVGAVTTKGKE